MPPHLTNQNVDVPMKQIYLNLKLTPLSLWQQYGPPSPSLFGDFKDYLTQNGIVS